MPTAHIHWQARRNVQETELAVPVTALPQISRPPNASGMQAAYVTHHTGSHNATTPITVRIHNLTRHASILMQKVNAAIMHLNRRRLRVAQRGAGLEQRAGEVQVPKAAHTKAGVIWSGCEKAARLSFVHLQDGQRC